MTPLDLGSQSATVLQIGRRRIASGEQVFVIAEAGVNHNGDESLAHRLIDVAADCGADAVKFQTFEPRLVAAAAAEAAPYQRDHAPRQRAMLEALALPTPAWRSLVDHAGDRGLEFLSTAFDLESLKIVVDLGVSALKVPSGEIDNLPFLIATSKEGLPLILSTGMATMDEVETAVHACSAAPALVLLHCVSAYPAPLEACNLRAIPAMRTHFGLVVGWSDHTVGHLSAVGAVALGASMLEKHLTVDRNLPGPDHSASADPAAFKEYLAAVRAVEQALGDGVKSPAPAELENRAFVRRSYHASHDLRPGDRVGDDDVELLRPAIGLPPTARVIGRVVVRSVPTGSPVTEQDLA